MQIKLYKQIVGFAEHSDSQDAEKKSAYSYVPILRGKPSQHSDETPHE